MDERCGSMIMEYVSWRTWSDIHQTSGECQWEWRGYNREVAGERGKERLTDRQKVHGISYNLCECHILWTSAVLGGDHLVLLFLSDSFVIHIFIPHSTFGQFFN